MTQFGPADVPREKSATGEEASSRNAGRSGRIPPPPREELERVRSRDEAALRAFFDRYFDWIYSIAFRMLGERALAEDISQDVFLKVHRALDRLDPDRDPAPWLATIVGNACREYWRGRHHKASTRSVPIEEIADWKSGHPRAEGDPEQQFLEQERHGKLRQAVSELPDSLQEVVILHDFREMSHKEIAAALGASHAAVRKRYSRALAALLPRLKDDEQ